MSKLTGEVLFQPLTASERAENIEGYAAAMKPFADAQLQRNRGEMVRKYRDKPGSWPDGADSRYDRWYRAEEWTDGGVYVGVGPCVRPPSPDAGFAPSIAPKAESNTPALVNIPVNMPTVEYSAPVTVALPVNMPIAESNTPDAPIDVDRKTYMRDYMRRRRKAPP